MSGILDSEIEQAQTQAAIMEEIAFGLKEYAGELDLAEKIADEKVDAVEKISIAKWMIWKSNSSRLRPQIILPPPFKQR